MAASGQSIGDRLKAIRAAAGQADFALALQAKAVELFGADGVEHKYTQSLINRLEKGGHRPTLQDIAVYAAVDPKGRSKEWIGWGDVEHPAIKEPKIRAREKLSKSQKPAAKQDKSA